MHLYARLLSFILHRSWSRTQGCGVFDVWLRSDSSARAWCLSCAIRPLQMWLLQISIFVCRWRRDGCPRFLHPSLLWCMHEKDRWQDDVSLLAVRISDIIRATAQDTEPDDQYWNTSIHPANTPLVGCRPIVWQGAHTVSRGVINVGLIGSAQPPSIWVTCHIPWSSRATDNDSVWKFIQTPVTDRICSRETWIGQLMNSGIKLRSHSSLARQ